MMALGLNVDYIKMRSDAEKMNKDIDKAAEAFDKMLTDFFKPKQPNRNNNDIEIEMIEINKLNPWRKK